VGCFRPHDARLLVAQCQPDRLRSNDAPWWSDEGGVAGLAQDGGSACDFVHVHEPDLGFAGWTVMPKNIGCAVEVEVTGSNDAPWWSDESGVAGLSEEIVESWTEWDRSWPVQ
jgi:hypothetical protein